MIFFFKKKRGFQGVYSPSPETAQKMFLFVQEVLRNRAAIEVKKNQILSTREKQKKKKQKKKEENKP